MSEKLVDISDPSLVTSGIVKSLHPLQVPLWINGQNVVFEDGQVRKAPGFVSFFTELNTAPISGLLDTVKDDVAYLTIGDSGNLYSWDGENITTVGTGFESSFNLGAFQAAAWQNSATQYHAYRYSPQWSMESWGSWAVVSNGINPIQLNKFDGAGFTALGGTPPVFARVLCRLKTFMLAFNTDLGGEWIEWCDLDNVEEWNPAAGSLAAGSLPIRDLGSEIVAAARLGDYIGVYSDDNMAIVQYVGSPYYFGAQKVLEGIGAVSSLCIIAREKTHYGLSKRGFWQTDGASFQYISPPLLREWLDANIDWANASKVAGYLNENRSTLEWGVPVVGGSGKTELTISYNFVSGAWSFRPYGLSCGLKKGIFEYPILGFSTGKVCYGEIGLDADGVAQHAWIQTKPFAMTDYTSTFTVDYILAAFKNLVGADIAVYVGIQQDLADSITWSDALTTDADLLPMFTAGLDGRFVSLRIEATGLGDDFWLAGFQIFGVLTGRYI